MGYTYTLLYVCLSLLLLLLCGVITNYCNMYIFVIFPNGPFILIMVIITEALYIYSLNLVKKQCWWVQGCFPCKLNLQTKLREASYTILKINNSDTISLSVLLSCIEQFALFYVIVP